MLLAERTADNATHIRAQRRLIADHHAPSHRRTVHRIVSTTARKASIGQVHPHQLRHTLATQAIHRGMRLEVIAALLRQEAHARMLGSGLCTRPVELECRMEPACETCAYSKPGPEFVPLLRRQRGHARK